MTGLLHTCMIFYRFKRINYIKLIYMPPFQALVQAMENLKNTL